MSSGGSDDSKKAEKDLSGLLDLSDLDHASAAHAPSTQDESAAGTDDAQSFTATEPEQIQEFESLDQLGLTDPIAEPVSEPVAEQAAEPDAELIADTAEAPLEAAEFQMTPPPETRQTDAGTQTETFTHTETEAHASNTMAQVREYSEAQAVAKAPVPAEYPFSLLIEGRLNAFEREKLLDILDRHQMGIDEKDLEPQFEGGRVLIPRISEYAGVLLVQALRAVSAKMRLAPSDEIFSTEATRDEHSSIHHHDAKWDTDYGTQDHPAETLPMTSKDSLPEIATNLSVIDTLVASATLRTALVEAEQSSEYQQVLEALQKELKYKAYHKGARGLVNFSINLTSLSQPSQYRLTVMATAVKV